MSKNSLRFFFDSINTGSNDSEKPGKTAPFEDFRLIGSLSARGRNGTPFPIYCHYVTICAAATICAPLA